MEICFTDQRRDAATVETFLYKVSYISFLYKHTKCLPNDYFRVRNFSAVFSVSCAILGLLTIRCLKEFVKIYLEEMNEHLYLCRNSTEYTKLNTEKKEMYKFMYLTLIEPIYTIKKIVYWKLIVTNHFKR